MRRLKSITRWALPMAMIGLLFAGLAYANADVPEDVKVLKQFREAAHRYQQTEQLQARTQSQLDRPDIPTFQLETPRPRYVEPRDRILNANRSAGVNLRETREVQYGFGRLNMAFLDSTYFNFLTGMNGGDTAGMDIMIIGNEGTHIGNETGLNFGEDYSPLLYLAESGSMDDFNQVPTIDDPEAHWVETTYDFMYGTQGMYLEAGSVWACYTRTEGMYVILEITGVYSSWSQGWINFNYKIQTDGTNVFDDEPGSILYGSSFMSDGDDTLRYFNYLYGLHGSDTTNMDVRASGNEGTNFGAEYSFGQDFSPIYLYATNSSLSEVSEVASVENDTINWVETSWEANGYQPMQVGDVWVIYTRTSHLYAVMEITYLEEWGGYFEFDYMIQTDGSTSFDGVMPEQMTMTVDGGPAADLLIGSNPYFEIDLAGEVAGILYVYWDGDHNGFPSAADIPIQEFPFMDNDMHDEDMTPGFFAFTYSDDMAEGVNYITDDLIFMVMGMDGGMASVPVSFHNDPSFTLGVSGTVYQTDAGGAPLEGIVVILELPWDEEEEPGREEGEMVIDITDAAGHYELMVPDTGTYFVNSFDHLMVTDGLMPTPENYEVAVMGLETGYNFYYVEAEAAVEGTVADEFGNPIEGVEVWVDGENYNYSGMTDENGYYNIPVNYGQYWVDLNEETVLPDFMMPPSNQWVAVGDTVNFPVDWTLFSANSNISGFVRLDGAPAGGFRVWAWNEEIGWSMNITDEAGHYMVPVHHETFYDLGVDLGDMPEVIQVNETHHIMAGDHGVMILLETVSGGMEGFFLNAESEEPILDDWMVGMNARRLDGEWEEYHSWPDPETGWYHIALPDGMYEITAGGDFWQPMIPDTVTISGSVLEYHISLNPLVFESIIDGRVRDEWNNPIPGAEVGIHNPDYGMMQYTDEEGYFHFDVPNGFYNIHIWAPGYSEYWDSVYVDNDYVWLDITLMDMNVNAAVNGYVLDDTEIPIAGADLMFHNMAQGQSFFVMTDESGYYWVDLSQGPYFVTVSAPGYLQGGIDELWVSSGDTLVQDFILSGAEGAIYGQIYNQDDLMPIPFAGVAAMDLEDSTDVYFTNSDNNGMYYLPVQNGNYMLFVAADGFEPATYPEITIQNDEIEINIGLNPMQYATPPQISYIMDQWADQGRWVRMQFEAGGTIDGPFHGYSIWRTTHFPGGDISDYVAYVHSLDIPAYNIVLPTLVDSNAVTALDDSYWSTFQITGHRGMWEFWDSQPMDGYSVDNIHPHVPGNLLIDGSGEDFVNLAWDAPVDADFGHFLVYRSLSEDFSGVEPTALIEHNHTDTDVEIGNTYYYMVKAVDANGNVSEGSEIVSTLIVSVNEARGIPSDFVLEPNYPNPFNPSTQITYGLPTSSFVSLEVYNILGQRVRTLVADVQDAGYITVNWDGLDSHGDLVPSGTYIYRLRTPTQVMSQKMLLLR